MMIAIKTTIRAGLQRLPASMDSLDAVPHSRFVPNTIHIATFRHGQANFYRIARQNLGRPLDSKF